MAAYGFDDVNAVRADCNNGSDALVDGVHVFNGLIRLSENIAKPCYNFQMRLRAGKIIMGESRKTTIARGQLCRMDHDTLLPGQEHRPASQCPGPNVMVDDETM